MIRQDFAKFPLNRNKTSSGGTARIMRAHISPCLTKIGSDSRSGRPSTSRNEDKIAQVKAVVRSDPRLTVQEIAQECHISVGSCDEILRKDLSMHRVSTSLSHVFSLRISNSNDWQHRLICFKVQATIRSS
ncbi:hypothetical protein TNCV_885341 [Trichonephila clavipes]|nr:hypothetical protein TNCV_885341 [Trichonephila clavipes]